jgi:hypothetical protein
MRTAYWLISMRRSGTHLIANYIKAITGAKLHNNIQTQQFLEAHEKKHRLHNDEGNSLFIIEDMSPKVIPELCSANHFVDAIGEYDRHCYVINVRDPINVLASRIKHWNLLSSEGKWVNKQLAYGWLGDFLSAYIEKKVELQPTIFSNYNSFITDKEHRKAIYDSIAKSVDKSRSFENVEDVLDYVDPNGGGSSFTGMDIKREKQKDNWKYYKDCPAFRDLIGEDLVAIALEYFDVDYMETHKEKK